MPDIINLISRWRKQIMLVVLVSLAIAASLVFIMPSQYLASSTALPTNPITADKSIVFNNNIRDLYNSLGQSGDLDKIVGTAQLDTIYIAVAMQYNLVSHYKIRDESSIAIQKAAKALKKNARITKSEYGELLVQVWDKDKMLAPQLANALMEKLAAIHGDLLNKNNLSILHSLKNGRRAIELSLDSLATPGPSTGSALQSPNDPDRATLLREQIREYEKLETEYQLMTDAKPAAIVIVERARISENPDKPKRLIILLATALASFLFALWLALILEKRKTSTQ